MGEKANHDLFSNRRVFKRANNIFPVEIYRDHTRPLHLNGESTNISASGACIYIKKSNQALSLIVSDVISLVINIPFSLSNIVPFRTISSQAIIKRVCIVEIDNHEFVELGIRFIGDLELNSPML